MKPILLLVFIVAGVAAQSATYCNAPYHPTICPNNNHIACTTFWNTEVKCTAGWQLVDINPFKGQIVDMHNQFRNNVAGGNVNGLPPAKNTPEAKWDDDLAFIAAAKAKTCVFAHDKCRSTPTYPHSGQNLYWTRDSSGTPTKWIPQALNMWYDEAQHASERLIGSYQSVKPTIGHFTVMVNRVSSRVGCAGVIYNTNEFMLVCNYSGTNFLTFPVYDKGAPGSECKKGRSAQYPNLCHTDELSVFTPFDH